MPIAGKAFAQHAYQAMRVRLAAAQIIRHRWRRRPPRPAHFAALAMRALRMFFEAGPLGLLRHVNARTHALVRDDYAAWVALFDELQDEDLSAIRVAMAALDYRPRLSVIMPVYNTDERWLRAAIQSVLDQIYTDWELCIADDHSPNERVRDVLREFAARDSRIKLVFRTVNGHISAASNSALALASGEFIALLDHDDVLPPHALAAVVSELNHHRDADLIYSDEDKIDERGHRFGAYFKPDWNPELFYGQNMVSHLGIYRTEIVRRVGGFREGFEGSQDYDLTLRVIEQAEPRKIRHIPHVLYHWRAIPGSTARDIDEKGYAQEAARRAIAEHFERTGLKASCEPAPLAPSYQRIRYPLPEPHPHVTIVIPTRDRADMLSRCIDSIRSVSTYDAFDVLIVDNGSTQPESVSLLQSVQRDPRISVLRVDEPFNFSRLNNLAAARARGALLCFLNNDTQVISADWLEEMASLASRPDIGAVGAMLYYTNDTVQHAGVVMWLGGIASHVHSGTPRGEAGPFGRVALTQAMSAVTAACLMVRKAVFDEVGGFDENLAVAYNDVDFCLRLGTHGYRNVWTPFAELYHFESVSRGSDTHGEARSRFLAEARVMRERWQEVLTDDPYYNPNLSLERADFALAFPPRDTPSWRFLLGERPANYTGSLT
jgi:GT2 family glycosyltransferase